MHMHVDAFAIPWLWLTKTEKKNLKLRGMRICIRFGDAVSGLSTYSIGMGVDGELNAHEHELTEIYRSNGKYTYFVELEQQNEQDV